MLTPHQRQQQGKGQDAHRSQAIYHDEFARPWEVVVDSRTKNFHPVSMPIPKFKAPLIAPVQYIKPGAALGTLRHDFEQWFADQAEGRAEWDAALREMATKLHPSDTLAVIANPPPHLRKILGAEPLPDVFIRAMRVGNRWITGKDPDADPRQWFTDAQLQALEDYKKRARGLEIMPNISEDEALFGDAVESPVNEYVQQFPEDAAQFGGDVPAPNKRNRKGQFARSGRAA